MTEVSGLFSDWLLKNLQTQQPV